VLLIDKLSFKESENGSEIYSIHSVSSRSISNDSKRKIRLKKGHNIKEEIKRTKIFKNQ
jgi:hypothetical protein